MKHRLLRIVAALTMATALVAGPATLAQNDTLAEHAPTVAAMVDSQVEPAAAAVHICNSAKSKSNIKVYNRGSRAWLTAKPGQCRSDALGEITQVNFPGGTAARSGSTCHVQNGRYANGRTIDVPRLAAQTWNVRSGSTCP